MDGMENRFRAPRRLRPRRLLRQCALALTGAVSAVVLVSTGLTYATLSDSASGEVAATAATVVLGGEEDSAFELAYTQLKLGKTQEGTLTVRYQGSVSADVTLELAAGDSSFCTDDGEPLMDVDPLRVAIAVPGVPVSEVGYCSLLKQPVSLGSEFIPGEERDISIAITLSDPAPENYRYQSSTDTLIVRASHGFTDRIEGSITINFDPDFPPIPAECADMSFSRNQIIELGNHKDVWDKPVDGPLLIFGGNGKDTIHGSDMADCIVGGTGKDTLEGHGGDDVLIGRPVDKNTGDKDTCIGGLGDDRLYSCETTEETAKKLTDDDAPQEQHQESLVEEKQRRSAKTTESVEASASASSKASKPSEPTAKSAPSTQATNSPQSAEVEAPKSENNAAGSTPTSRAHQG